MYSQAMVELFGIDKEDCLSPIKPVVIKRKNT